MMISIEDEVGAVEVEHQLQLAGYPPSLAKACIDHFDYVLALRDGTIIRFNDAMYVSEQWVRISHSEGEEYSTSLGLPFPCPRGVDIRVSEIAWCADAPNGS